MFDYESFGLLLMLVSGNMGVYAMILVMEGTWGTAKKNKGIVSLSQKGERIMEWAVFAIMLPFLLISLWITIPLLMDIPWIMAGNYKSIEGTAEDYYYGREVGGPNTTGFLSVKDANGKVYHFKNIHVPRLLETGDRVKVDYRKYGKNGVIREINGRRLRKYRSLHTGLFLFIMLFLLLAMPVYSLHVFKWKRYFNWKEDYSICVYHDRFVQVIWAVEILMLQSMAVMVVSILKIQGSILDVYWGFLISGIYGGILSLSFLRHKRFILIKDRFYYRSFKQKLEGSIEEIELVERREKGVVIGTKGEEIEIMCTKEKYVEELMKKIGKEEEKNDGE